MFGIILYFTVGFGGRDNLAYLFQYLAILFVFALVMSQQLAVFATFANSSTMQAYSATVILVMMLFSGFIIAPDTIPRYYIWLYWWNPFAWMYRSLVVLEFRSSRWDDPDDLLRRLGFMTSNHVPFGNEWYAYSFIYMVPYFLACCGLTAMGLSTIRNEQGKSFPLPNVSQKGEVSGGSEGITIPFKPVTLSFHDVSYEVAASTKREKLKLLTRVDGIFRPGRMCALMGSSGKFSSKLRHLLFRGVQFSRVSSVSASYGSTGAGAFSCSFLKFVDTRCP
jgi:hypothetical protein